MEERDWRMENMGGGGGGAVGGGRGGAWQPLTARSSWQRAAGWTGSCCWGCGGGTSPPGRGCGGSPPVVVRAQTHKHTKQSRRSRQPTERPLVAKQCIEARETQPVPFQRGGWWSARTGRGSSRWAERRRRRRRNWKKKVRKVREAFCIFLVLQLKKKKKTEEILASSHLVRGPVHPSLGAGVDVDEQQPLHHVGVVQLHTHTNTHTASHDLLSASHTLYRWCRIVSCRNRTVSLSRCEFCFSFPRNLHLFEIQQAAPPAGEQLRGGNSCASVLSFCVNEEVLNNGYGKFFERLKN